MHSGKPCRTLRIAGQSQAFDQADQGLDMHPPQFLIPLELLRRVTLAVEKVVDAAELGVPAEVEGSQHDLDRSLGQGGLAQPHRQVHDEPHRFDSVARIEQAAFERVAARSVRLHIFADEARFLIVKHIHHFVNAIGDRSLHQFALEEVFQLQREVAQDHGQREALERPRSRIGLVPDPFGVASPPDDVFKSLAGNVRQLLIPGRRKELPERHGGKAVGKNITGLNERPALTGEGEVPVKPAVVAVFVQKARAVPGHIQPLRPFLHPVVERREHPYLAPLQPDKFVGVIHHPPAIKAGKIAAMRFIAGIVLPEGDDLVQQSGFIFLRCAAPIHDQSSILRPAMCGVRIPGRTSPEGMTMVLPR